MEALNNHTCGRDLKGKEVLVVGLARTGFALAGFLSRMGAVVTVTDLRPAASIEGIETLRDMGVSIENGVHNKDTFLSKELIVLSPGVPYALPILVKAREHEIEVISEIELACRFIDRPILVVTGTNGKTTVTTLLGRIFKDAGKNVFVCGNIGTPLIEYVDRDEEADCIVAEISSFQLEGVSKFRPKVAILLNITEDHLDRHLSIKDYARTKFKVFENQGLGDTAIINVDDPVITSMVFNYRSDVIPFSSRRVLDKGLYYQDGKVIRLSDGNREVYTLTKMRLKGMHNNENIMAVIAAARAFDIEPKVIQYSIDTFDGLPHRMEVIETKNGVTYCNDSKSTNCGSLLRSLEAMSKPIILIAGGKDKGGDYGVLKHVIGEKVRLLILIGEASNKMKKSLKGTVETVLADTLEVAMEYASSNGMAGDTVLLSPGCSSFDMFSNFEERGDEFRRLVKAL